MDRHQSKGVFDLLLNILFFSCIVSIYCFDAMASLVIYEIIIIVLFCFFFAIYAFCENVHFSYTFAKYTLPFVVYCFLSCIWSYDRSVSYHRALTVLEVCVFSNFLFEYVKLKDKGDFLINILILSGTLFSFVVIIYYGGLLSFVNLISFQNRVGGDITQVNRIGQSVSFSTILCIFTIFRHPKKILYYFLGLMQLLVLIASQSRTALITTAFSSFLMLLFIPQRHKTTLFLSVIVSASFLYYTFSFFETFETSSFDRFESLLLAIQDQGGDVSAQRRLEMIDEGFNAFLEHPVLGMGLNTSGVITSRFLGEAKYLHNNYIEILASLGILGFIIFFYIFYVPVSWIVHSIKRIESKLVVVIVFSELVMFFGCVSYYVKFHYLYLVLIYALSDKVRSDSHDEPAQQQN